MKRTLPFSFPPRSRGTNRRLGRLTNDIVFDQMLVNGNTMMPSHYVYRMDDSNKLGIKNILDDDLRRRNDRYGWTAMAAHLDSPRYRFLASLRYMRLPRHMIVLSPLLHKNSLLPVKEQAVSNGMPVFGAYSIFVVHDSQFHVSVTTSR